MRAPQNGRFTPPPPGHAWPGPPPGGSHGPPPPYPPPTPRPAPGYWQSGSGWFPPPPASGRGAFPQRPAGIGPRFVGYLIDGWVSGALLLASFAGPFFALDHSGALDDVAGVTSSALVHLVWVFVLVIQWMYWVGATARTGRTLGKRVARTRVVDMRTGQPPGRLRALVRFLLYVPNLVFWPLVAVNLVVCSARDDERALHDLPLRTMVVWAPRR